MKVLRFILHDQLNLKISSLTDCNKSEDWILMCEAREEFTYVRHHQKKIAFLLSAMRHFAQDLKNQDFQVDYQELGDGPHVNNLTKVLQWAVKKHQPDKIVVTFPSEYRILQMIKRWKNLLDCPVEIRQDNRFLCDTHAFHQWAKDRKNLRMEFFYREMRKQHGILMDHGQPVGGQWNYDANNRKPPKSELVIPPHFQAPIDTITQEVLALVKQEFGDHFGDLEPFYMAVTRAQALQALEHFIQERLASFGDFQDAMIQNEPWMYHSHLSFYLNCGLIFPQECIQQAEQAWHTRNAPLNAVEGFIRQILGWREYVRGLYWLTMPEYASNNFLQAHRKLPEFFWTAETSMNCLKQCIQETKRHAYAHHIQRLMVIGNFALLTALDPQEVNEWYLIVYADAYEWVELPNVTGMILFADGGYLASKPYAASGAYINKMSNYCKACSFKVTAKTGEEACPFNYLYWNFLIQNQEKLKDNPRLKMIYKTLEKMDDDKKSAILSDSANFLSALSD